MAGVWHADAERYEELLPIVHFMMYDKYNLEDKNKDLDRIKLKQIAMENKQLLVEHSDNENIFINKVLEEYGTKVLDPAEYKIT
tara:strand:- start:967 stop:1218 length:252 start_codon:yes stop_codon:yes gene_type:complete